MDEHNDGSESPDQMDQMDMFVISGIAGKYPESKSIAELEANLYAGTDMVTSDERRWPTGYLFYLRFIHLQNRWKGLPARNGKIDGLAKFDASFFGIAPKQVNAMDCQMRILLEVVYEAIVDAGVDPSSLRGSRTGVFLGISGVNEENALLSDPDNVSGYVLTGCQRSMIANRISYHFDFQGPSFPIDTACSSSLLALQLAVDALRKGDCESAIVCGSHLNTHPVIALMFLALNMLAPDGKCKSFDSEGVTVPSGERQLNLLREVYEEAGVPPNQVHYVEAHGTGTKVGDPQEAYALTEMFCRDRANPLLIGAVKSNLGHSEPSSALSSIAKVILSMERGVIPPNLHFENPNPYIPALVDGRLKVVSEATVWDGGYVGINSFGFGGANTHALLKSHPLTSTCENQDDNWPTRLQCVSSRTEEGVRTLLEACHHHKHDKYFLSLVSDLSNLNPFQAIYRGFTFLKCTNDQKESFVIKKVPLNSLVVDAETKRAQRPLWYIYSGMGSQWIGMAKQLRHIDVFRHSVRRCAESLRPFGVDIHSLLFKDHDSSVFDSTTNCMICISAIQIGLTDILKCLEIVPDGIVGHSMGEIACGYADGCLTRSQAMRIAYHRGNAIMQGGLQGTGSMAAVGLSLQDTLARLPKGVHVACHNAVDSITISGDTDKVNELVKTLQSEDIFAKVVDSAGVPFHSPSILSVKADMLRAFNEVLPVPVKRSMKWISSSVSDADQDNYQYCSADYQANNAVSKVLFYDALKNIPENAVTVEIGPSALLHAILKRTAPKSCTHIGLLKKNEPDELEYFLSAIGGLHLSGIDLNVQNLYGPVQYPVPRGTPQISPLIRWDHEIDWFVADYGADARANRIGTGAGGRCSQNFTVQPNKENSPDAYLTDHVIDGRKLYPFTGYLYLAWQCLAKLNGQEIDRTAVIIEDFTVLRATLLSDTLKFQVFIRPGDGSFNILESDTPVCNGRIRMPSEETQFRLIESPPKRLEQHLFTVHSKDIYKELLLRGYEYGPQFRGLDQLQANAGRIKWTGLWVPFLDACIQTWLMAEGGFLLRLPTTLRYMRIDPSLHDQSKYTVQDDEGMEYVNFVADLASNNCIIGGVEIGGLKAQAIALVARSNGTLILEKTTFVSYEDSNHLRNNKNQQNHLFEYEKNLSHAAKEFLKKCQSSEVADFSFMNDIFSRLSRDDTTVANDEPYDGTLMSYDDTHTLMSHLNELIAHPISRSTLIDQTKTQYNALLNDPLFGSNVQFDTMKRLIDVAIVNTHPLRFKWAICDDYPDQIIQNLSLIAVSQPRVEIQWLMIGNESGEPDTKFIESLDCTHIDHDFSQTKKTLPTSVCHEYDLVVLHRVLSKQKDIAAYLRNVRQLIKDGSFIMIVEPTSHFELNLLVDGFVRVQTEPPSKDPSRCYGFYMKHADWLSTFKSTGYELISFVTDDSFVTTAYLIRAQMEPRVRKQLDTDDVKEFSWLPELQSLIESEEQNDVNKTETILNDYWMTSTKVSDNGLIGMGLSLRDESSKSNQYRVVMNCDLSGNTLDINEQLIAELSKKNLTVNCFRDGTWGRFHTQVLAQERAQKPCENAYINVQTKGDMSSASWIESEDPHLIVELSNDPNLQVLTQYYSPLNFRDIMLATGRLPVEAVPGVGVWTDRDKLLGLEVVGRLPNGRRVCGIACGAGLATNHIVDTRCCYDIPDSWTMEEAATIPMAYATTFYALLIRAKLKEGEKILIHSGTGAVGQAAIQIALFYECEVFTTVGSDIKRAFIKERFPQLDDAHIANSRSTQFELDVLRATKGTGVDVVLNSLAGDKMQASIRCLAEFGRFCEIGKFDLSRNTPLGMEIFLKSITFHGVLLDAHHVGRGENEVDLAVKHYMRLLLTKENAIRPLSRTVFSSDQVEQAFRYMSTGNHIGKVLVKIRDEEATMTLPRPITVNAIARTYCNPKLVYVITGGLGGFGLELIKFLIERGAKRIVITSRTGPKTGYQKRCIAKWAQIGVDVIIDTSDISHKVGAAELLQRAMKVAPIGGIFHLAMVLRDNLIENQTVDNFQAVSQMKYWGTKNLDQCSRNLCDKNLQWFVVFSSVTAGRGNAGQSAYGWGNSAMERIIEKRRYDGHCGMAIQWGAIGDVGIVMDNFGSNDAVVGGTSPQRMMSCIQCLDIFMTWNHPIVSSFVRTVYNKKKDTKDDVLVAIADILGVSDASTLKLDVQLTDFGIDSLIGVELRQLFERDYNLILTMKDIRTMTLKDLKNMAESSAKEANTDKTAIKQTETDENKDTLNEIFKIRLTVTDIVDNVWEDLCVLNKCTAGEAVYFVHAIEGIAAPLRKLAQSITAPVLCFQHTEQADSQALQTLAKHYVKVLRAHKSDGEYMLVGYSYGACIAFEMACQLHDAGCRVNLVMLDASPKYWAAYKANYRRVFGIDEDYNVDELFSSAFFESELAANFAARFGVEEDSIRKSLLEQSCWGDRLKVTCDAIVAASLFPNAESVRWPLDSFKTRFIIADKYTPTCKYGGNITLVKATIGGPDAADVGVDYGLRQIMSGGELTTLVIEGDHDELVQGDQQIQQLADIINVILSSVE